MPEKKLCTPFPLCENLDGRLLINRTLEGPPLAKLDRGISLSGLTLTGVRMFPYLRVRLLQTWKAKEACIGPARSILGLAPGEEITFDTRMTVQFDFGSVVTNTQEFSSSYDSSYHQMVETTESQVTAETKSSTDTDSVDLGPLGSWGCGGDTTVSTIEEIMERTTTMLKEILVSASYSQTNSKCVEVSSSTQVLRENSITRVVRNPYYDRSLELRFHPVFREFEVTTTFLQFNYGIVVNLGKIQFPAKMVTMHGDFLDKRLKDRNVMALAAAKVADLERVERISARSTKTDPLADHLNANAALYTAGFLKQVHSEAGREPIMAMAKEVFRKSPQLARRGPGLESAIAFDKLRIYGDRVMLPARSADHFKAAFKLSPGQVKILDSLDKPSVKDRFKKIMKFTTNVHLFMGTHVEAIAGSCVLKDVPLPGGNE